MLKQNYACHFYFLGEGVNAINFWKTQCDILDISTACFHFQIGDTALHKAASNGHPNTCEVLLKNYANVNAETKVSMLIRVAGVMILRVPISERPLSKEMHRINVTSRKALTRGVKIYYCSMRPRPLNHGTLYFSTPVLLKRVADFVAYNAFCACLNTLIPVYFRCLFSKTLGLHLSQKTNKQTNKAKQKTKLNQKKKKKGKIRIRGLHEPFLQLAKKNAGLQINKLHSY